VSRCHQRRVDTTIEKSATPPPTKEEYNSETNAKYSPMKKTLTLIKNESSVATTEQESGTATTTTKEQVVTLVCPTIEQV
jgi:hypothetical protein